MRVLRRECPVNGLALRISVYRLVLLAQMLFAGLVLFPQNTQADADYHAVFYPTAAHWDETTGKWVVPIHGFLYGSKVRSPVRWFTAGLGNIYAWLERREDIEEVKENEKPDPDDPSDIADVTLMKKRIRPFLLRGKKGGRILLRMAGQTWSIGPSDKNGYIKTTLYIDASKLSQPARTINTVSFEVFGDDGFFVLCKAQVFLVPPDGISVVTDIDDTIKKSEVLDREELLENTLLYPFYSVEGMAEWYQKFDKCSAAFHYVSKSPWQLYEPLNEFFQEQRFPAGSFHLAEQKSIRSLILRRTQGPSKKDYIDELLRRFPKRKFILVGDSTQKDPAIYAELAAEYPNQVRHIFIRQVGRGGAYATEALDVLRKVNKDSWTVFTDPSELPVELCA
jgi:phosphatidate phosphatase APP1